MVWQRCQAFLHPTLGVKIANGEEGEDDEEDGDENNPLDDDDSRRVPPVVISIALVAVADLTMFQNDTHGVTNLMYSGRFELQRRRSAR